MRRALLPALVCAAACAPQAPPGPADGAAGLMRNLLHAGTVEVSAGPGFASEPLRRAASLRSRERDGYMLHVASGEEDLPRIVLASYGDLLANRLAERMGVRLGLDSGQPWFAIDGLEFRSPEDAFVACFEDPDRPGLPLTLYYANDEEHLARLVAHELDAQWQPSLRAWKEGREALHGPLAQDGRIDPERLERADAQADFAPLPARTDGLVGRAQAGIEPELLAQLLPALVQARASLQAWAAPGAPPPQTELELFARPEDYTRAAGSDEAATLDPLARCVHVCLAPGMPSAAAGAAAAARGAGRALLGECALPWLEDGAALDAAASWWGEPLESWLNWIAARGLALPLERVVDARADAEVSPHLLLPLRAALFRLLRETRGDAELRALWSGAHAFAPDAALTQAFEQALAARAAAAPAGLATRRGHGFPVLAADGRGAWRGVEGEPTIGGASWASEPGARSVALAQKLGANAYAVRVSIVARPVAPRPRRLGTREGDLQVWAALVAARARGMATFVDVDVLATSSGVEDGAWPRVRPEQWQRFFATRDAALVHSGLLAQLAHADALSIGCDLPAVTPYRVAGQIVRPEDLEARRAGWSALIARTRACFEGALVYVAAPASLAQALFSKDLDALGFRLEVHLEPGTALTPAELAQQLGGTLQQLSEAANALHLPWFLARTGFEPTIAAPGSPGSGPGAADPHGIRLQLESLGRALRDLPPASRPAASFLWRWPSDPEEHPLDPRDVLLPRTETLEALRDLWR